MDGKNYPHGPRSSPVDNFSVALYNVYLTIAYISSMSKYFASCSPVLKISGRFYIIPQKQKANFNNTWHIASLGKEDSYLYK